MRCLYFLKLDQVLNGTSFDENDLIIVSFFLHFVILFENKLFVHNFENVAFPSKAP